MYQKALVPLDGSGIAEYALEHVRKLSKIGAIGEVILLQVVESHSTGRLSQNSFLSRDNLGIVL